MNNLQATPHGIDAPGLLFILFGQGMNTLCMITRTDLTYFLGLFSTVLAIVYYLLKLWKEWRTK